MRAQRIVAAALLALLATPARAQDYGPLLPEAQIYTRGLERFLGAARGCVQIADLIGRTSRGDQLHQRLAAFLTDLDAHIAAEMLLSGDDRSPAEARAEWQNVYDGADRALLAALDQLSRRKCEGAGPYIDRFPRRKPGA